MEIGTVGLKPGLAAVVAVFIAKRGLQHVGFAAGTEYLDRDDDDEEYPADGPVYYHNEPGDQQCTENINWIADFGINSVRD